MAVRVLWLLPLFLLLAWLEPAQAAVVVYPQPDVNDHAWRFRQAEYYPIRLLEEALRRSGHRYQLRPAPMKMTQSRVALELQNGRGIDVMWTMTTRERERDMLPVRIPIYKGLIGWRLLLVRSTDLPRFAGVRTRADLASMTALQGHDWPDTAILRANDLPVNTSAYYNSMFPMLANGRADYFPRSIIEIWNEAEANRGGKLVVEPTLLLRYPAAFYFFVNKGNGALARDIEAGLDAMLADGSFDRLFHQYYDPVLKMANLPGRRVIDLTNPLLPAETPLQRKELWLGIPSP